MRVLLSAIVLLLLAPAPAFAAELPAMLARTHYVGEIRHEGGGYRAHLYFGLNGGFVLREDAELANGKVSGWETTGEWRQIRGRAFVQLTNSAQRRLLTVGGEGALYLEARLPSGAQATVALTLREPGDNVRRLEFSLTGKLRLRQGKALITDDETGIVYQCEAGEASAQALVQGDDAASALPVHARLGLVADAEPSPTAALLRLEPIQETRRWEAQALNPAEDFLRDIAGKPWMITRMGAEAPPRRLLVAFRPDRAKRSGTVELVDGGSRLRGNFALQGREISFSAPETRAMRKELARLLHETRTWRLVGEVLELWGEEGRLALLESPRR
jgi:hypothetical protein